MEIATLCGFVGGVPERSKGADCKSAGSAFEGSNPSPSTTRGTAPKKTELLGTARAAKQAWQKHLASLHAGPKQSGGRSRQSVCELGNRKRERGCSSMVEQKPSKLTTRVRFPSPAPTGKFHSAGKLKGWQRLAAAQAHVAQW